MTVENPDALSPATRTPAVGAPAPPPPDVVIAPQLIREVKPVYPPALLAAGLEGDVILDGVIGTDGKVSNITVVRSTHTLFSEAAIKAWLECEFTPARRNGVPKPTPKRQPFTFKIRQ